MFIVDSVSMGFYLVPLPRLDVNVGANNTKSAQSGLTDFSRLRLHSTGIHSRAVSPHNVESTRRRSRRGW